ncbi:HD domain-containing protein [Pseudonocardia nigra]|uniref:HD domain-containing protein n=1 Tax=Pseudonocardia nigra TaxID=1921578 RepID=UPI0027E2AFFB|nr:HD domain-containing protein [Pseudonocardia nigra]
MAEADGDAAGIVGFAFELGVLKRLRRTGWSHAGIRDAESVAEHSLRVAQLAALIAAQEGADPARAALLAVWHDSQETRTGDLPHTARPYLSGRIDAEAVTADQVARLPEAAATTVREAVTEYESQISPEARCARDADKLECLLQAVEYRAGGNAGVEGWIASSREALRTDTALRIAEVAVRTSPLAWRDR